MCTDNCEGFMVHHQLKFSCVLPLKFMCTYGMQYTSLSTPLVLYCIVLYCEIFFLLLNTNIHECCICLADTVLMKGQNIWFNADTIFGKLFPN